MKTTIDPSGGMKFNGWAEASFFLGFVSIPCIVLGSDHPEALFLGIFVFPGLAIVFGLIGRHAARRSGDRRIGSRLAAWGISLGVMTILAYPCLLPFLCLGGREAARRAQFVSNLKEIGFALNSYQNAHGCYPPAVVRDSAGKPLHSWRVLLLPYMDQSSLYEEFHLDEPWDSPHNQTLLPRMPYVYAPLWQAETSPHAPHSTCLQVFVGPGTAFEGPAGEAVGDLNFPDGIFRTIAVVDAARAVPWTQPIDLPYGPNVPLPELGGAVQPYRRLFRLRPESDRF
jgi:hypothetical protein